jgi:hypothetical protein
MERPYPRTKFSETATPQQQLDHVLSEAKEVFLANLTEGAERTDEEIADLEHSI